jgi:hypothetical protein
MSAKAVDTSVICSWLGIPPDQWPPDHYTLLGLPPGEKDPDRIERHVQQRLEQVRRYQLTTPEPATEAMNRLAQAFVCLTDPQARQAYDERLFGPGGAPSPGTAATATAATDRTIEAEPTVDPEFLALVEEEMRATHGPPAPAAPAPPPLPTEKVEPIDADAEAARSSRAARRGLGTRRALYERIVHTRELLRMWERAGRYLGQTKRRLSRPAEARDFIEVLTTLLEWVEGFPPLLGEAGQPGYLVLALAKQPAIVPTFQTLLPSQRQALARDWEAGQKVLAAHRDFLRQEARALRRKTILQRAVRAVRSFLNDNPSGWLIFLGLVALAIALARSQLAD